MNRQAAYPSVAELSNGQLDQYHARVEHGMKAFPTLAKTAAWRAGVRQAILAEARR